MAKNKTDWFDVDRLLSYNATLNFVIAERGVGKTFGCKKKFLENFLKKGEEFVCPDMDPFRCKIHRTLELECEQDSFYSGFSAEQFFRKGVQHNPESAEAYSRL